MTVSHPSWIGHDAATGRHGNHNGYIQELTIIYVEVNTLPCTMRASRHAEDRMIERGISRTDAVEAITKGAKRRRGPKVFSQLRGIEVVYVQKPCNQLVITIYRR